MSFPKPAWDPESCPTQEYNIDSWLEEQNTRSGLRKSRRAERDPYLQELTELPQGKDSSIVLMFLIFLALIILFMFM